MELYMLCNEYQKAALETAIFPDEYKILYPALGLAGEAGEVAELIKKMIRDDNGELTEIRREKLRKELGDVLWYVAVLSAKAGFSLDEIAVGNIDKLNARKEQGTLQGSGSDR